MSPLSHRFLVPAALLVLSAAGFAQAPADAPADKPAAPPDQTVTVKTKRSLVHLGSIDTFTITDDGRLAADRLYDYLIKGKKEDLVDARKIYTEILPKENFGGEYSALAWFCDYMLADKKEQAGFLTEKLTNSFFVFWSANKYANLKEYLLRKYKIKILPDASTDKGKDRLAYLEDFILFNNPRREDWEKTSEIIKAAKIEPGMNIADLGCGPGYYTFRFSEMVGDQGKVLALDITQAHTEYVAKSAAQFGRKNIEAKNNTVDNAMIPEGSADVVFMCSLYHIIYTTNVEKVKDRCIASIKRGLKPDGRFVVVDNGIVEDDQLPYHGPHIAQELIIGQLQHYGFKLVEEAHPIPQRYVLVFKKQ